MPVDDPTTHLELTMIHEGMVLDHSGPELAAIQTTAAIKLTLALSLMATLLNPWTGGDPQSALSVGGAVVANVALSVGLAVRLGAWSRWSRG